MEQRFPGSCHSLALFANLRRPLVPQLYYANNSPAATDTVPIAALPPFSTNGGTCSAKARWRNWATARRERAARKGKRDDGDITGSSAGSSSAAWPERSPSCSCRGAIPGGCIVTILLGIAGALLAGLLGHALGWYKPSEGAGFIAAIVGAFILLLIYRLIARGAALRPFTPFRQQPWRARDLACASMIQEDDDDETAILAALALGACGRSRRAAAQPTATIAQPIAGTRLDINATGEVTRVPDLAIISAGVVTRRPTATRGHPAEAANRMERVRAALKRAGIADRDIQTSYINLNPEYRYENNQPPQLVGYSASNQLTIRFRDIRNSGQILDALVAEGRQPDQRPDLTIDKPEAALDEARAKAVATAEPGRALCARAGHAGGAPAVGQRKRRLSGRRRRCRCMRGRGGAGRGHQDRSRASRSSRSPWRWCSSFSNAKKKAARLIAARPSISHDCARLSGPNLGE